MSKFVPREMWLARLWGVQELTRVFVEKKTASYFHLRGGKKLNMRYSDFCLADKKENCLSWLEYETKKKIEECEDDILRNVQHIKFIRGKMIELKEENK